MLDEEVEDIGAEEGGEEEAGGEAAAPAAAAHPGGFWGSLKGIITACTGLIVAVGGLITVLSNSGVIGDGNGANAENDVEIPGEPPVDMPDEPDMPTDLAETSEPETVPTPEPTASDADETRMFVVVSRSDGWAAVRSRPTIGSTMLSRLETGDFVRCGRTIDDAGGVPNRFWRYCPEVEGHIAASLLRRVRD